MLHLHWRDQVQHLLLWGDPIGPRGLGTRETLNYEIKFNSRWNIIDDPSRKLNYRFMVAEWIWMMLGKSDLESIAQFNSVMRNFSDDGMWLTGAYGPHIKAQMPRTLRKLKGDPATRQAVIEIPRPQRPTKDEPCTLSLQFLNRNGALHCIATMRSSDIWLGLPYDTFTFSQIQNGIAGELGLERGWLSLRAGSSHLYDTHVDAAKTMLANREGRTWSIRSPNLPGPPPDWFGDLLVHRTETDVPDNAPEIWKAYAKILLSNKSETALKILRSIETL